MHGKPAGRTVTSIFFGGGTPSLMAPATVAALLDEVAALWQVDPDCEITLEANPSSVEAGRFAGYRAAGVNRVSLGDAVLQRCGTALSGPGAYRGGSPPCARHRRPPLRTRQFRSDLRPACSNGGSVARGAERRVGYSAGHLSLYQLTIEPETPFSHLHRNGRLQIPSGELAADLYDLTQELCEAAGLPAYEVSNHAPPGQESRHNLTYWRYGDYVGVGPGAHGRIGAGKTKIATAAIRGARRVGRPGVRAWPWLRGDAASWRRRTGGRDGADGVAPERGAEC